MSAARDCGRNINSNYNGLGKLSGQVIWTRLTDRRSMSGKHTLTVMCPSVHVNSDSLTFLLAAFAVTPVCLHQLDS